jgi:hypothetical protein
MKKHHEVESISFESDALILRVDGELHRFSLDSVSSRLLNATFEERTRFEISPSGYGIHWPMIDEDLSIDGLLGIDHSPTFWKEKAA